MDATRNARALVAAVDPGRFRYSMWENISIGVWQGQATREAAQRIQTLSEQNRARFPHGHSSLIFILAGAPAPTEEANAVFAEMYRPDHGMRLSCLGLVLEGDGFWASVMRSTVTGMRMRSGSDMALRAEDSLDALLPWFAQEHTHRTGIALDPDVLEDVLWAVRSLGAEL